MHTARPGFSLFEVMLTIVLIAIVCGFAIPSFGAFIARNQQRVEIDALFHAIHHARKESVMRRTVVSLCPSTDLETCSASQDWSWGWLMFENKDRDSPPRVDAGEPILTRHRVAQSVHIAANRRGFTLRATFLRATNGTFVFCDRNDRIRPKALVISYTGRPRVADHKTNRDLYSCAG